MHPNHALRHHEGESGVRILRVLVGDDDGTLDEQHLVRSLTPRLQE